VYLLLSQQYFLKTVASAELWLCTPVSYRNSNRDYINLLMVYSNTGGLTIAYQPTHELNLKLAQYPAP
jgi:hypothetical protein